MDLPLEIKYQGIDRSAALDRLVARQAAKLERFHPHITSVRVGLSRPHRFVTDANPHRVRIRCMVPPGHELLVVSDRAEVDPQLPPVDALVGEIGQVMEDLPPAAVGRVELRGSAWSARNASAVPLSRGTRCRVVRVDGLMLFVEPEGAR